MRMNLTTDPWIPIVWQNGQAGEVSLIEIFQRGEDIQDLAMRPQERIALMRLVICIAQVAIDGPKDYTDWQACRSRIALAAVDYLEQWRAAFELFGDKQRFLQVSDLKPTAKTDEDENASKSVSKLDLSLATENNSTLFDNAGGSPRGFTPAQLALMLLTFQCFSPCGRIGVAKWKGKPTPGNGSSDHAPCLVGSMLHALLRGATLLETIHRNLLDKETVAMLVIGNAAPTIEQSRAAWGRPSWEQFPASSEDTAKVHNTTSTYLGRLVPLSRAIRLQDDGITVLLANGLEYPPYDQWREPSCTIVQRKDKSGGAQWRLLNASLDRAPWRELHALSVRRVGRDSNGGPVALRNTSTTEPFDLWVGGLVADKAKLLDTVEAVFHMPANMLTDPGQRLYEDGVGHAQELAIRLSRAVITYRKGLGDDLTRRDARDQAAKFKNRAAAQFWTDIERDVQRMLDVVADPASLTNDIGWSQTVWGKACWTAALRAFDATCQHNAPRQMQAFALAQKELFRTTQPDNPKDKPKETEA